MPLTSLVDRIDAILPQTQCTQCGYDGCRPYARAIANEHEAINRCPPGGPDGIRLLAELLEVPQLPLDESCGSHQALNVAVIDEAHCIGCTLCIQACPVDAIVGANKLMHTVIADRCTGCDLCVAPCPVDCIAMVPANRLWTANDAASARRHHQQRQARLAALHDESSGLAARTLANKAPVSRAADDDAATRKQVIADALARARARRQHS
ncbi:electron transport complex subunit RsxB [Pollutimonas thiosulfatoxidans]|uniref:Electron transport complex subunit RsxB n=1 Tax=Pollutimonas thiosulfatoxidans TaxID=2028345 RepID=A0A451FSI7_9BURK|nr:electron transport complex subunit RsxB [Pollutimonas thiosulfatoxidans]NYT43367.1 electron transport complex subunit RsxB [Alcaligenaceae bacterium]QAA95421.1 electron transport complex subunit RsxB [Pollutimonas thiosulfatoxidans]